MLYRFFAKKTGSRVNVNEKLGEELHKTVIKKFRRRKVYVGLFLFIVFYRSKKKSSVSKTKLKRFIILSNWAVFGKTINFC